MCHVVSNAFHAFHVTAQVCIGPYNIPSGFTKIWSVFPDCNFSRGKICLVYETKERMGWRRRVTYFTVLAKG